MPSTGCPNRSTLFDYLVGKLPDETSDSLATHVGTCPDCQAELATLSDVEDTLIGQLRGAAPPEPYLDESECGRAIAKAKGVAEGDGKGDGKGDRHLFCEAPEGPFREKVPVPFSPPETSQTSLPAQLGEYRLIERLGSGGMGAVYKAVHNRLHRVVALKILPRARTDDPRAIVRFEREMEAIGRLDHPHIVRAYDAREIEDRLVLVMEFVEGLDLGKIVRRLGRVGKGDRHLLPERPSGCCAQKEPDPFSDACELARQAALGLQIAHEHGMVHRDVKPSNLMLTPEGQVKLLDLGLARLHGGLSSSVGMAVELPSQPADADDMTGTGQAMGTADYMAPEQTSDSRMVDIRADIYSLGATLYKLLSGRAPFSGPEYQSTFDKMLAHRQTPPPPIQYFCPGIPQGLVAVLDRMLAKDPAARYQTPMEAAEALAPFCAGADLPELLQAAVATTSPLPLGEGQGEGLRHGLDTAAEPQPAARRWRTVVAAIVALLLVGGLGFAGGIMIRIYKDGQETTVEVPEGSHARVGADGSVAVTPPGAPSKQTASENVNLQFEIAKVAAELAAQRALLANVDEAGLSPVEVDQLVQSDPVAKQLSTELGWKKSDQSYAEVSTKKGTSNPYAKRYADEVNRLQKQYDERVKEIETKIRQKRRSLIETEIVRLQAMLAALRQPHGGDEKPTFTAYALNGGNLDDVLGVLKAMFQGEPNVRLAADREKNRLIVAASPAQHARIQAVLRVLIKRSQPVTPAAPPPTPSAAADAKAIQGTWEIVSSTFTLARKLPGEENVSAEQVRKTTKIVITADTFRVMGKHVFSRAFDYQLNPDVKPNMIDFQEGGLVFLGIYQLNGNNLKICAVDRGENGTPRPTEFWAEFGADKELLTLRRVGDAVVNEDEKAIQGTWRVEKSSSPGNFNDGQQIVISSHFIEMKPYFVGSGKNRMPVMVENPEAVYAIDPTSQPKAIDFTSGNLGPSYGIYELQGDRLTLCFRSEINGGQTRPTKFAANEQVDEQVRTELVVLKRVSKPAGQSPSQLEGTSPALKPIPPQAAAALESVIHSFHAIREAHENGDSGELLQANVNRTVAAIEQLQSLLKETTAEKPWAEQAELVRAYAKAALEHNEDQMRAMEAALGAWEIGAKGRAFHKLIHPPMQTDAADRVRLTATKAALQFGPVIERVINARSEGKGKDAIDLLGGKLVDLPKDFCQWPPAKQGRWCDENNVDLLFDTVTSAGTSGGSDLVPAGLKLACVDDQRWTEAAEKELRSALGSDAPQGSHNEDTSSFPSVVIMERSGVVFWVLQQKPPLTFAFQTRKGVLGLLQVLRYTEEPEGVRIRYKLVQQAAVPIAATPPVPEVPVCHPVVGDVTDSMEIVGRIEASQTVEIRSRVTGELVKVHFTGGSAVKQGDLLFEIDPQRYQAELDKRSADLLAAKTREQHAIAELKRAKTLTESHSISPNDLDRVETERKETAAAVLAAEADLRLARTNLDYTRICAPIGGTIGRPLLSPGSLVTAGTQPLATVYSDQTCVAFDLDQRSVLDLIHRAVKEKAKTGRELPIEVRCRVADEQDYSHRGTLESKDPRIDPATGTAHWRATLSNPDGVLVPGLFARVRLLLGTPHKALLVPEHAIYGGQIQKCVMVIDRETNIAEYRGVQVGQMVGELRVITKGLTADDYVVTGPYPIIPGMLVKPKLEKPLSASPAPPANDVNAAAELKALQGQWKVASVDKGNNAEADSPTVDLGRALAKTDRLQFFEKVLKHLSLQDGSERLAFFRIDPAASPKTIDLQRSEHTPEDNGVRGVRPGETFALGCYEVTGDRLTMRLARFLPSVKGEQRPKGIDDTSASGGILFVLERYHPSDEEKAIQGDWAIASQVENDKVVAADEKVRNTRIRFCDGSFIVLSTTNPNVNLGDTKISSLYYGPFVLNPAGQLKSITLLNQCPKVIKTGLNTSELITVPEKLCGIYKCDADRLTIAFRKGDKPPQKFESQPGSGVTLLVLEKAATPKPPLQSRSPAVSIATPNESPLDFGPLTERTLNAIGQGKGGEAIDFREDKLVDMPKETPQWTLSEQRYWLEQHNVDLALDYTVQFCGGKDKRPILAFVNSGSNNRGWQWRHIAASRLATATSAEIREELWRDQPIANLLLEGNDRNEPSTFSFITGKGDVGVMQVVAYRANPRSVTIRYRVAKKPRSPHLEGDLSSRYGTTIVKLPQGSVELIAVTSPLKSPFRPGPEWWSVDGKPVDLVALRPLQCRASSGEKGQVRTFLFRFKDLPADASTIWTNLASAGSEEWLHPVCYADGIVDPELKMVQAVMRNVKSAKLRIRVDACQWETGAAWKPDSHGKATFTRDGVPFWVEYGKATAAKKEPGSTDVSLRHCFRWEWKLRLLAIGIDGREKAVEPSQTEAEVAYRFDEIPLSSIKEFRFQVRRYYSADFYNVALNPQSAPATEVKNSGEAATKTASPPNPATAQ